MLQPENEVPATAGAEAAGYGAAAVTFNLVTDAYGATTAATLDVSVTAAGFPNGTTLTDAHIHAGAAGANGGIVVSFGLTAGEVTFPTGSGSFTKTGIAIPADLATAIAANPGAFYVNIHTAANPGGVARGQLARVQ